MRGDRAKKKVEIVERHLLYEVSMLRYALNRLRTPPFEGQNQINSLIETFCIHARNLIDFFWDDRPMSAKAPTANHVESALAA